MTGIRVLHRVDREESNGVDAQLVELVLIHEFLLAFEGAFEAAGPGWGAGLRQPPSIEATRRSPSGGPQLPGS